MPGEAVTRTGPLTERSLLDAIADEHARDREPALIACGSAELRLQAMRILAPGSGLDELRAMLPRVEYDEGLDGDAWELREA